MSSFVLTVFTHPACSGCPEAVREAWAFTQKQPEVELNTVTLAEKKGLAEARRARITIVPALILSRGEDELERWQGMPVLAEVETAVESAMAETAPAG